MSIEWFAGLFEGEGYIGRQPRNALYMTISSTDLDVLEKAQSIIGGRVKGPRHDGNTKHKPRWEWNVTSRNEVLRIAKLIYPHLCSRRRRQFDLALNGLKEIPERRKLRLSSACGFVASDSSTTAGAKRHVRRGEKPCPDCASANRNYLRNWRAKFFEANP